MSDKYHIDVRMNLARYNVHGTILEGLQPGQVLTGHIQFRSLTNVDCRGVWLEIGYLEQGYGSHHENRMVEMMIHHGSLRQDQMFNHNLNFRIPENAPISYRGEYAVIEWYVRLRVDIPIWTDTRKEFYFKVLPYLVESRESITQLQVDKVLHG